MIFELAAFVSYSKIPQIRHKNDHFLRFNITTYVCIYFNKIFFEQLKNVENPNVTIFELAAFV